MLTEIIKNGQPWFIASEICKKIGVQNHRQAIFNAGLTEDEQAVCSTYGRKVKIVSETGMLLIIGNSRKSEAKEFMKVLYRETLPRLRHQAFSANLIEKQITITGKTIMSAVVKELEK